MNVPKSEAENNRTPSPTKIRVIGTQQIDEGTMRGIADVVRGPSAILKELPGIQQPGQRAWASLPSREWQGTDGKRRITSLVELTGFLKSQVEQAILEVWERSEGGHAHG